jgi:2-hydroxy-6-oxonona-2,4-dienedioate hydrolase
MSDSRIRSRYVMAGHIKTHYSEAGHNGPPVVLCHGGGAGSSGEAGFGKLIEELAGDYQVYAPDSVGGFGETDPYYPASEGVQTRVDQLEAFIDNLCLDQIFLSGNSQGAWVAAKYAIQHPERVRKLMLVASATISIAMGLKVPPTDGMRALQAYDGTPESMRRMLEVLVFNKSIVTDELVELRNNAANRPGAAEARKSFAAGMQRLTNDPNLRFKYEMNHLLPRLPIPTQFIWGEQDNFAPVDLGHQLEKLLPNIKFHYIPQAGHQVQNDQPQVVGKLMKDFFSS